jgi:hypothetical protein
MKRVSKEQFDKWYEDNVTAALDRTPKWNGQEQSITWKLLDKKGKACMIVLNDPVEYYVNE